MNVRVYCDSFLQCGPFGFTGYKHIHMSSTLDGLRSVSQGLFQDVGVMSFSWTSFRSMPASYLPRQRGAIA